MPLLLLLIVIAALAGSAALTNCALLAAVFRRTRYGIYSILAHLALTDILILSTISGPEIWTNFYGSWPFGLAGCIAFQGLSVFSTTALQYFTTTIALHSLTTANLEQKALHQTVKKRREDDEEIQSSRHSLVANSDSSTPPRTMNIDYRVTTSRLRTGPPIIFVWILAASLSIPEFALSTVNQSGSGSEVCCLADAAHRFNMQTMLAVFNVLIPVLLFVVVIVLLLLKLKCRSGQSDIDTIASVRLSLCLILVYCIMSLPRSVMAAYRVIHDNGENTHAIENNQMISQLEMWTSFMYLAATIVRPLLCLTTVPRLRNVFKFGAQ